MIIEKNTNKSVWAPRRVACRLYGLTQKDISYYETIGYIRTFKKGSSKQSSRLYHCPDIEDLLLRLSAGCKPLVKRGKLN